MFLLKATDNYGNIWYAIENSMEQCVIEIEILSSDYINNLSLEWFEIKPLKVTVKTVYEFEPI